jgi:hypothetical protein
MKPGDSVLLRTVVQGRVREALPLTLVEETGEQVALYCAPGTRNMRPTTSIRHGNLTSYDDGWDYWEDTWRDNHVLWLASFGKPHLLNLFWNGEWTFLGWYVQLQDPLRRTRFGFDTRDHALDVWVEPDGSWEWKDEDELARAVELGLFGPEEASAARATGERVVAERPWPTGWEDWRPDPAWQLPRLPEDLDVV